MASKSNADKSGDTRANQLTEAMRDGGKKAKPRTPCMDDLAKPIEVARRSRAFGPLRAGLAENR